MRALIIHSAEGKLNPVVDGLSAGLANVGFETKIVDAGERSSTPIPVVPYDVIVVGSPVLGFLGGRVANDIGETLKRCTRMEGKRVAAFVTPKPLGTTKALRRLMGLLEQQGAWVEDFATLNSKKAAIEFGERLKTLAG